MQDTGTIFNDFRDDDFSKNVFGLVIYNIYGGR